MKLVTALLLVLIAGDAYGLNGNESNAGVSKIADAPTVDQARLLPQKV